VDNIAEKMNLVIDYIESHLTEELDPKKIEQIACCSYYDVGRIFSLVADITLSDYIRRRRLTLAGIELKYDGLRVIDASIKYGYDSPVSFARAFQAFHGFNPSLANRSDTVLNVFPRLVYQLCVKGVLDVMKKEKIVLDGKEYEASYFGEADMSFWSQDFSKRRYWRLENAYDDFKDKITLEQVLPYNNYPPINIEFGQVFVIDYYKLDGGVVRRFYIADGTVWNDLPCTREFILDYMKPIRCDKLTVCGKEYNASYFGEQDMSYWSDYALKREFWRLENADGDFEGCSKCSDVLPYNNYPPINIQIGQVFVIDYHTKQGKIDRKYYIADGTIWRDMPSTRQFMLDA